MALVPWPAGQPLRACMFVRAPRCARSASGCSARSSSATTSRARSTTSARRAATRACSTPFGTRRAATRLATAAPSSTCDRTRIPVCLRSRSPPPSPACRFATAARGSTPRQSAARARRSCSAARRCRSPARSATAGRYRAAPHRVRCARKIRHSLVFELRATFAHPLASAEAPRRSAAAADDDAPAAAAEAEARSYVDSFVREQLRRGSTFAQVLGEFSVPPEFARPPADADALVTLRSTGCAAARSATRRGRRSRPPSTSCSLRSFGDCTGMYVDVHVPRPGS